MEKKITDRVLFVAVCFLIAYIYKGWFIYRYIIGGDWSYLYLEYLQRMPLLPQLWMPMQNNGLGGLNPILNLQLFHVFTTIPSVLWPYMPWHISYKILWFGLFIVVSFFSSLTLSRKIFPSSTIRSWMFLAPLIYLTNTYVLMMVGGGQMGVALAYATMPLVISWVMSALEKPRVKLMCISGLVLGIQVLLDPRIAYISAIAIALYVLLFLKEFLTFDSVNSLWKKIAILFGVGGIALVINAYWLVPLVFLQNNPLTALGSAYTSQSAVTFFSFTDFSHTLSLLHPNWSENIFGKTYFMQPEFLLIPIVAFISLFFLKNAKNKKYILYMSLLGLVGAFLSKGVKDPFGLPYLWMYQHVPGFVVFRDPTKFYVLIAMAYSVLIPFSIGSIEQYFMEKNRQFPLKQGLLSIVFIMFWFFLIRQAVIGSGLGGTFAHHDVPQDYLSLKDKTVSEDGFFRTLWVPRQSRFSYYGPAHRAMEATELFEVTTSAQLIESLEHKDTQEKMMEMAIKYIVVPMDPLGEIFLEDRKFSQTKRDQYIHLLDLSKGLSKMTYDNNIVYKTQNYWDLFHVSGNNSLTYKVSGANRYRVRVTVSEPTVLYFSESFHTGWVAVSSDGNLLKSSATKYGLNSFEITASGTYDVDVYFSPQKYGDYGYIISAVALCFVLGAIILVRKRYIHYNV